MSGEVSWIFEVRVRDGREKEFRALMQEMVSATQANEPHTIAYEWSTSADGRQCHIYERYADSAAVMTHLATFGAQYAARFDQVVEPVGIVIYGAPNEEVKAALADLDPVHMEPAAGFNRA